MDRDKFTQAGSSAAPQVAEELSPKELSTWLTRVGYKLYEFAYADQAAHALLREHEDAEKDEGLTGVGYLLRRLSDDCDRLQNEVSEQGDRIALGAIHG
jgi:hypothetical protein